MSDRVLVYDPTADDHVERIEPLGQCLTSKEKALLGEIFDGYVFSLLECGDIKEFTDVANFNEAKPIFDLFGAKLVDENKCPCCLPLWSIKIP